MRGVYQHSARAAITEGEMLEPQISAQSGIRCDGLCPFIAERTSFTAIINQRHQYLTEFNGLTALGKDASEPLLLFMVRSFYVHHPSQNFDTRRNDNEFLKWQQLLLHQILIWDSV